MAERRALLSRARAWVPVDTARADLLAGPPARDGFAFDAGVACAYHYPDEPLSGTTLKFLCNVGDDVVKVKYGPGNDEVFAEVAATRLFWALGFVVDRMYPVRVVCLRCPASPHRVSAAEWHLGKPASARTRSFPLAVIERPFAGERIEVDDYEGWSWAELEDPEVVAGERRAEIDALKLLAAFVQHVDSKPEQQALVCPRGALARDREGNQTCARPLLMITDLGSTFAAASKVRFRKMRLASWRSAPVWKDAAACQAHLTSSLVGTLQHPRVSEAGRRFLARRLALLSDRQLRDLFTAARVERTGERVDGRPVTVADWVKVFKAKRAEIVSHRCAAA